jgi:Domain of unknown function (DUF4331)
MSHHLDTPLAAQNGQLYIDDLFVFKGERGTVFVMDVNSSITGDDIKYGFHPEARYELKIHRDGGDTEKLTYRVAFGEPDPEGRQSLTLHALTGAQARDDGATGTLVAEGRTGEVVTSDPVRVWAGRIRDPFYIDLDLLMTVNAAFKNGAKLDRSAWRPENAQNSFAGRTVESIVLEVTDQEPMLRDGARIGVWCVTKLATDAGGWRPVNRAGHPMMWPIFWPTDTDFSTEANFRHPAEDMRAEGKDLAATVGRVVAANGTALDPEGYGMAVAGQIFPDLLPYQVGSPANYGFAVGNGRTMYDNAPEVMFSIVLNMAVPSGLGPDVTTDARSGAFPYVVAA